MKPAPRWPVSVAGIPIPQSTIAHEAVEFASASLPRVLVGHACRVFVFAALATERRQIACEREPLYVAAMFMGIGLSSPYGRSQLRYEVDSANAAQAFMKRHRASLSKQTDIWHAVALHMTPGIPSCASPLAGVLAQAVRTDLLAEDYDAYTAEQRDAVLCAYPRGAGFRKAIIDAIGQGVVHRPASTFGTVCADVLDRTDPNYRRTNFCGLIFGAQWDDQVL